MNSLRMLIEFFFLNDNNLKFAINDLIVASQAFTSKLFKGELQPKIIFCLLTCFSTKERQVKRLPSHRRRSVENSGRKITIFSAAVAARSVT